MKRHYTFINLFLSFLYLEIAFKLFIGLPVFDSNLLLVLLFTLSFASLFTLIFNIFGKTFNHVGITVLHLLLGILFSVNLCLYKMYGFYFEFSLLTAAEQVTSFGKDILTLIKNNIWGILSFLVPFVVDLVIYNRTKFKKLTFKLVLIYVCFMLLCGAVYTALIIKKDADNKSVYEQTYKSSTAMCIEKLGVMNTFMIDSYHCIRGYENSAEDIIINEENIEPVEEVKEYDYNVLDIDFDALIENDTSQTLKKMDEYFKNSTGTKQNEYTGFFEGKNLILFMAESFNEIAVRKDLTPTLYKLVHNGFYFPNFYTPTIYSTIGGEFQELTGLYANPGFLGYWREGKNSFPMGVANMFKNDGYKTYAYHNHHYQFQNRDLYLAALGFDNYKGCWNGLEEKINCLSWPGSDVELIEATFDDYINSNKFMVYYATVSGHGSYSFDPSDNYISYKNQDYVKDLGYSIHSAGYLAAQIELDRALEILLQKLEQAGKLDDTVIALVGDHHPYYLTNDEVNEISDTYREGVIDLYHSNFILYNSAMENVTIKKTGSQIDVLPTIYNLFGLPYDSRLFIGNDIMSSTPGLAIMGDWSWVSDKGKYYSYSGKFIPYYADNSTTQSYVDDMNAIVSNRVNMSLLIMQTNYYKHVFGE